MKQRFLDFRVHTSVIKKVRTLKGGIDEYLLTTYNRELLYNKAVKIKNNLRYTLRRQEREVAMAERRAAS
jgi:hypothetical protein